MLRLGSPRFFKEVLHESLALALDRSSCFLSRLLRVRAFRGSEPAMSGSDYFAWILAGLMLLPVCAIGAIWLGSLARQAWRDIRQWLARRWARRFIDDIRRLGL